MKQKKWIDCPSCGARGSMKYRKNLSETYRNPDYELITVNYLDGYFCDVCNEGIFTIKSNRKIVASIADEKARQDSKRVVASSILDVDTVAKTLSVSRQRVHQMMTEGKLSYVYVGKNRFPVKTADRSFKLLKKKMQRYTHG